MDYKKLHEFILFVLLQEGRSNIKYNICHFIFGERFATRHYFKIIFEGCDNSTFLHYCHLFKEKFNNDISIKVGLNSKVFLTGEIIDF